MPRSVIIMLIALPSPSGSRSSRHPTRQPAAATKPKPAAAGARKSGRPDDTVARTSSAAAVIQAVSPCRVAVGGRTEHPVGADDLG
ncbi:hypothetical protein QFZ43_000072 [Streptomyces afghaniensis]|nr:hypothetical protein [Streptomyces afghaniensis]